MDAPRLLAVRSTALILFVMALGFAPRPLIAGLDEIGLTQFDPDQDRDGAPDQLEFILGTSAETDDSDGDGYGDGIELARQSDPLDRFDRPTMEGNAVQMLAYRQASELVIVTLAHFSQGLEQGADYSFNYWNGSAVLSLNGNLVTLPVDSNQTNQGVLVPRIMKTSIHSFAQEQIAVGVQIQHRGRVVVATTMNILVDGSELFLERPVAAKLFNDSRYSCKQGACVEGGSLALNDNGGGPSAGSIYLPMQPMPKPDSEILPNHICFKATQTVGYEGGGIMVKETVAADCISGFEGYCNLASCTGSVGELEKTFDPLILIGE